MEALSGWYRVRFDEEYVYREVEPAGSEPWADRFSWDSVTRVCFLPQGPWDEDELYFFTSEREESYLIPGGAQGMGELWGETVRRNLFPMELLAEAMSGSGKLFCWPAAEEIGSE